MDAVLKHLKPRSDYIVCHPDVIDDPVPPTAPAPPTQPANAFFLSFFFSTQAAFSAHLSLAFHH